MKKTEIELAGECVKYCRKQLFLLRYYKRKRLEDGYGYWSERMEKELQKLEAIFAEK